MNKRGQFYIIAAVIIVIALSSIIGVSTYSIVKKDPRNIERLTEDLKTEGPRIIDYGVYNNNIDEVMERFTESDFGEYFVQKSNNANILFVYGDKDNIYLAQYNTTKTGEIVTSFGENELTWQTENELLTKTQINPEEDTKLNVTILDATYNFDLIEGQMFYFIIIQDDDGDRYVKTN